MRSLLNKFY
jgi:hypothetical protein